MKGAVQEENIQDAAEPLDMETEVADGGNPGRSAADEAESVDSSAEVQASTIEGELSQVKDQLLRLTAEFQNYRRRTEQSRVLDTSLGKSMVVQQMLGVFDDLGRSLDAARDLENNPDVDIASSYETLRSGVNLVFRNFQDELKRLGLREIDAVGKQFDESVHEALMQQPAPDGVEPGTVLSEIQKGYVFGDRVLRHSKVIVAS
ncbi:MAG: nucleotide exchange factor GrpE [Rhodothermales bacterium]